MEGNMHTTYFVSLVVQLIKFPQKSNSIEEECAGIEFFFYGKKTIAQSESVCQSV